MPQEVQEPTWRQRLTDVQYLLSVIQESMKEQYFIDDSYIDIPFDQLVRIIMESGEMFACFADEECRERSEVSAFVLLRDIRPGRDAWIEAYSLPQYRGHYPAGRRHLNQILEYCFAPWNPEQLPSQKLSPKGLGLRKLKAQVSAMNTPACQALKRAGFMATGISPADGLFKGQLTDIITVEKMNPILLPREPLYAQRSLETSSATVADTSRVVHASAVVAERSGGDSDLRTERSASDERASGDSLGAREGERREGGIPGLEQLRERVAESEVESDGRNERGGGAKRVYGASRTRRAAGDIERGSKRTRRK